MGAAHQPRDTWGRWTARPTARATAPVKPTAAPVFTEGTREVHLTDEATPHYQVWDGEELLAETPACRRWRKAEAEAIALARGVPRDMANLTSPAAPSPHGVINTALREALASARSRHPFPAPHPSHPDDTPER